MKGLTVRRLLCQSIGSWLEGKRVVGKGATANKDAQCDDFTVSDDLGHLPVSAHCVLSGPDTTQSSTRDFRTRHASVC